MVSNNNYFWNIILVTTILLCNQLVCHQYISKSFKIKSFSLPIHNLTKATFDQHPGFHYFLFCPDFEYIGFHDVRYSGTVRLLYYIHALSVTETVNLSPPVSRFWIYLTVISMISLASIKIGLMLQVMTNTCTRCWADGLFAISKWFWEQALLPGLYPGHGLQPVHAHHAGPQGQPSA